MFRAMEKNGVFLGYAYESPSNFFFFGSKHLTREALPLHFPKFQFAFLKQVHGREVVQAEPSRALEGDGHFTRTPNLALVSQTADCIPLLMVGTDWVCALHAGWRGVALNIVSASAGLLPDVPQLAVLGPHIRKHSFEVGPDVATQLASAAPKSTRHEEFVFAHRDPAKHLVDLSVLIRGQLNEAFAGVHILDTGDDTKTSDRFHSFRRDREKAGRQYSFVVIKA